MKRIMIAGALTLLSVIQSVAADVEAQRKEEVALVSDVEPETVAGTKQENETK